MCRESRVVIVTPAMFVAGYAQNASLDAFALGIVLCRAASLATGKCSSRIVYESSAEKSKKRRFASVAQIRRA